MARDDLSSKQESFIPGIDDSEVTIERCPHDEANPYTMIHNGLIRDKNLSPECCWLIIYLLANKNSWTINVAQIINDLKERVGRDKVYKILDEAMEIGYIKRELRKKGNLKQGFKYYVSETPKFKKILRRPESQYAEVQYAENTDLNKDYPKEKPYEEEDTSLMVPTREPDPEPERPADAGAAKAADVNLPSASTPKKKKPEEPHTAEVLEVADKMLSSLKAHKPNYVQPRNLTAFLTHVDYMLRLDNRSAVLILDVLNWCLSDYFWKSKLYKPNPAKYLQKNFDQLEEAMNAKPPPKERKFAPSSNDERSLEKFKEWSKGAIT